MKLELYLISPHEEYAEKHACRKHWNYQWGGRRGSPYDGVYSKIKLRKESFGGLLLNSDGKLYKVDISGYKAIKLYMDGKVPCQIIEELQVDKKEVDQFFKELKQIGIVS